MPATKPASEAPEALASVQTEVNDRGVMTIRLSGRLNFSTTGRAWREIFPAYQSASAKKPLTQVVVDASQLDYCDGAGIGLLVELQRRQHHHGGEFRIHGLSEDILSLLGMFQAADFLEELHVEVRNEK